STPRHRAGAATRPGPALHALLGLALFIPRAERLPAAAGTHGLGVPDGEPAAHERFDVIDLAARKKPGAEGVDHDANPVLLQHDVVVARFRIKPHGVGEAAAAAGPDHDARSEERRVRICSRTECVRVRY